MLDTETQQPLAGGSDGNEQLSVVRFSPGELHACARTRVCVYEDTRVWGGGDMRVQEHEFVRPSVSHKHTCKGMRVRMALRGQVCKETCVQGHMCAKPCVCKATGSQGHLHQRNTCV